MTVGEFLDGPFLEYVARRERSGKLEFASANTVRHDLKNVDDLFRDLMPREVTPDDVEALYDRLQLSGGRRGQGLATKSIKNLHSDLQQAFNFARREG